MNFSSGKIGGIVLGGHVQGLGLVRSLGEAGIPVIVADTGNNIARYSKYCRKFVRCPPFQDRRLISFLLDLCRLEELEGWVLYPTNDFAVVNISQNRQRLLPSYRVMTPGFDVVQLFSNKKNTFDLCEKSAIPYPRTWYPQKPSLEGFPLSFPILIKGISGLPFYSIMKKKVIPANNPEELIRGLKQAQSRLSLDQVMIQEEIPFDPQNRVVSFTSFCLNGEILAYCVWQKVREHPLRHGTATCCVSIHEPRVLPLAKRFLLATGYSGISEIEFLLDPRDQQFKVLEANPRTFLQIALCRRVGFNFPLMMYKYLNGIAQLYPETYPAGIYWIHFWTDLFFAIQGKLKKEYQFRDIFRPYRQPKIFAVLSKDDLEPFIMETFLLPYLMATR